jgi:hypothetical protein
MSVRYFQSFHFSDIEMQGFLLFSFLICGLRVSLKLEVPEKSVYPCHPAG